MNSNTSLYSTIFQQVIKIGYQPIAIIAFLLIVACGTTTYAQSNPDPVDSTAAAAEEDNLKTKIKQFLKEFTNIKRLDQSMQVRHQSKISRIKHQDKEENAYPIELTVYTKLNIDEVWARWLTGKWVYTASGKKDSGYVVDSNGIDLNFEFDSLSGEKFMVTSTATLNDDCRNYLAGLEPSIDPTELENELNEALKGWIANQLDKPKEADLDNVIDEVFDFLLLKGIGNLGDPNLYQIQFAEDPNLDQTLAFTGFDSRSSQSSFAEYEKLELNKTPYYVAWKAVKTAQPVSILTYTQNEQSFDGGNIRFKDYTGSAVQIDTASSVEASDGNQSSNGGYTSASARFIQVKGMVDEQVQPYSAFMDHTTETGETEEVEVGRLNVIAYPELQKTLYIIPVNDASVPSPEDAQAELNKIYGQAAANWIIHIQSPAFNINTEDYLRGMDYTESGYFSSYPEKCKTFNDEYKKDNDIDKDAYYIFLIKGSQSDRQGFMPFKKHFGYVFVDRTDDVLHTMAHELGHGAFHLRHPFDEFAVNEGTTDNLMDNHPNKGKMLRKYQWDYIHHPESMIGWLQDDEESSIAGKYWFDPKWDVFTNTETSTFFSHFDEQIPQGTVPGFVVSGTRYQAQFDANDKFENYGGPSGLSYKDSPSDDFKVHLFENIGGCKNKYYETTYGDVVKKRNNNENLFAGLSGLTIPCSKTHFETNSHNQQYYVDLFESLAGQSPVSLDKNTVVINALKGKITAGDHCTFPSDDEGIEGKLLIDHLNTYEKENGKKFYVVHVQINTISGDQNSWNRLAKAVFKAQGLSDDDILITLPYVVCEGLVTGSVRYYMPGIAKGNSIMMDVGALSTNYDNTTSQSKLWETKRKSIGYFVKDVLAQTKKKYQESIYYINYKGDILAKEIPMSEKIGFPGTYNYRFAVDRRFEKYAQLVTSLERSTLEVDATGVGFGLTHQTNYTEYQTSNLGNNYLTYKEQLENFLTYFPTAEEFVPNHGMFEQDGISKESVRIQFAKWYRDHEYATLDIDGKWFTKAPSPADECFVLGKNHIVYEENLMALDGLGIMLASVGMDWIADGVGMIYTGYYGDYAKSITYGIGVLMPVISGGLLIHGSKAAYKGLITGESKIVKVADQFIMRAVVNLLPKFKYLSEGKLIIKASEKLDFIRKLDVPPVTADYSTATVRYIDFGTGNQKNFYQTLKVFDSPQGVKCAFDAVGGFCFPAGTKVWINQNESQSIESLKIGNQVLAYNHQLGKSVSTTISNVFRKKAHNLTKLIVAGVTIISTNNHPYFANGAYTAAENIHIGDSILSESGNWLHVTASEELHQEVDVYNIEVKNQSNYFVSDVKVLVHNVCSLKEIKTKLGDEFVDFFNKIINSELSTAARSAFYIKLATYTPDQIKIFKNSFADNPVAMKKLAELWSSADDVPFNKFMDDFVGNADALTKIKNSPELINSWMKLFKEGDVVSDALRKDINSLEWFSKNVDGIADNVADDLLSNLNGKTIERTFEDAQGRLVVMTESSLSTRRVVTVEKTASGEIKSFKYTNAYNKAGQPGKPPISVNGLTPDFSGNPDWLFPVTGNQKNIVRIKLTGKRNGVGGDFDLANKAANLKDLVPSGKWKPDDYTWHHLDDFDPVTGESTLQLVKTVDHQGALPHSGSAKQWSNYTGQAYL